MNNEKYNQMIDDVYKNYCNTYSDVEKTFQYEGSKIEVRKMTQEEFIEMIKTDDEFSKKWGLKIEESELTYSERKTFFEQHCLKTKGGIKGCETPEKDKSSVIKQYNKWFDEENIPTKLITITYNNKTIESYE